MEKIKIEKNTIQETLILPLYGRKVCSEKFPQLYTDIFAKNLCDSLDYDFSEVEKKKDSLLYEFTSLEAVMRQLDMIWEIKAYLKSFPKATIVNIGCGLDETGKACDNGLCHIVNIDFPEVIAIREQLVACQEREKNLACDLREFTWMDEIDGTNGVIFFAAGVFHYFKRDEIRTLVLELSNRYPKGVLVFDSVGKIGMLMIPTVLKKMGISDVKGLFYINKPQKDLNWSKSIKFSERGYMLGYYDMKAPGIRPFHRFLAKIADKVMKMAIYKITFEPLESKA